MSNDGKQVKVHYVGTLDDVQTVRSVLLIGLFNEKE